MARKHRAVHVAKVTNTIKGVTYTSYYLRRTFRQDGKVQHETLGNLSDLPVHLIDLIRRSLKGETFVPAADAFKITRSLPHGHVEAVLKMIRKRGLDDLIASEPSRRRDLVVAMIAERLLFPSSKLANTRHWHDTTLAEELDVADTTEDQLSDAMDWLLERQSAIEKKLAKRHLSNGALVLDDVTSSSSDGKTGLPILVSGTLTDADGRPVAVQVDPGNTGDPSTVPDQVEALTKRFGLSRVVLVGDRGMLTQTQIDVLKRHPGLGWISALRSGAIRRLLADGHLIKRDLEAVRLAEISSPEFPGERLVACYNPQLAEQRRQKRAELLAATEAELEALAARVARPTGPPETAAASGWPWWSRRSDVSRGSTSWCVRSTTARPTGCGRTSCSACWPTTWSGTCARCGSRCCSRTRSWQWTGTGATRWRRPEPRSRRGSRRRHTRRRAGCRSRAFGRCWLI